MNVTTRNLLAHKKKYKTGPGGSYDVSIKEMNSMKTSNTSGNYFSKNQNSMKTISNRSGNHFPKIKL
jgi:hypothetical protein